MTATTAELNILDGVTATTAELNFVDGVTSNVQTQLNAKQPQNIRLTQISGLDTTDGNFIVGNGLAFVAENPATALLSLGVTSTAAELNILDGVTATTAELNILDGVTATTAELNILDGVTATTAELNILDGVTATTAELNILDGVTATTAELNILDGVTATTADLNAKAFDTVALLLADTTLTYSTVTAGNIVRTRSEGFAYQVAASGASDHNVTTAGSVKLYVLPGANGVAVDAFGAVGDGTTDDAAVLTRVAAYASANQTTPIIFDGFYRSTSPLVFNSNSLRLVFSVPGRSGILFDNCDGITINQTLRYAGLSIDGGVLATNVNKTRTGLTYANSAIETGDMLPKVITALTLIGLDRFLLTGSLTNGWLTAVSVANADRLYVDDAYVQGSEQDRVDGFPIACKGIVLSGSTHLVLRNPHIFCMETAVEATGQCEGLEIVRGTLVANKKGINFAPTGQPSNDTNIVGVHIASMEYNISLTGLSSTIMHNVSGCLLFTRDEAYVSSTFKHIILDGASQISDNFFFTAVTVDPASHTGVGLIAPVAGGVHTGSLVSGNKFYRVPTIVNIGSGVTQAAINGNVTVDDLASLSAAPVVDAGTGTAIGFNFGDRDFGEAKSDTGVFWSPIASPGLYHGPNKNLILSATQGATTVVNYVDVVGTDTGSSPIVRVLGTDADIDLILQPKGARPVRSVGDVINDLGETANRWRATYSREFRPGGGTAIWTSDTGTPEGVVTAPVGSLFTRTDGGAGTTLYVKESGVGNTGWVAK